MNRPRRTVSEWLPAIALLLLSLISSACIGEEPTPADETSLVRAGDKAPDFTVEMTDGSAVSLADLRGRVVLLTFFSTECPACRAQMSRMQREIVDRFADHPFRFLPISRGGTPEAVEAFCEETGILVPAGLDPEARIYGLYATRYVPRNLIVDPTGTVVFSTADYDDRTPGQLIERIEAALAATE